MPTKNRIQLTPFRSILMLVPALIASQYVASYLQPEKHSRLSGPHRGDVLLGDCLPKNIEDWTKTDFSSGEFGSYVCSEAWEFTNSIRTARVSFDQAKFNGWHELTECYSRTGWTFESRTVHNDESDWPFVVSIVRKDDVKGIVIFSLFYSDGIALAPPTNATGRQTSGELGLMEKVSAVLTLPSNGASRQCQVFSQTNPDIKADTIENLISLHLATREALKSEYLRDPPAANAGHSH